MRNLRWQLLIAIGGFILVIGLLVGQTPDGVSIAPEPVPGGVFIEALVGEIIRLNPVLDFYNQPDRDIDRLLFSGLIRFNSSGLPQSDLAEWAVTADATLYTITLREDAVWHDGETVTADDVIYTFSKLQDQDYPGPRDLFRLWKKINIIRLDNRRVQFQLPEPFAPFLDYLTIGLLPDHLLRGVSAGDLINHPFNLSPIGTGPFRFDRFLVEDGQISGVSLVAFEDYYEGRPFFERAEFRIYPDAQSAYDASIPDDIHGISPVDVETLPEVLDSIDFNLHSSRLPKMNLVFLNSKNAEKPFISEKNFRQALLLAINRQWIIDEALFGQGVVPSGPIAPSTWAHSASLTPMPFSPEVAADLLDGLGWELPIGAELGDPEYLRIKDEEILSLELVHTDNITQAKIAEMIKKNWEAVGIQVTLNPVEPESILDTYLEPRNFEAVLAELSQMRSPDPDPYPFWHDSQAESGQNYGGFTDRNISIWLEQARITPDFGRRASLYKSFQHRFQSQVPALLLFYPIYNYAVDAQVLGVTIGPISDPSDRFNHITSWHLLSRPGSVLPTPQSP
jgi:peptide/nickel transport system substrate-binding protein